MFPTNGRACRFHPIDLTTCAFNSSTIRVVTIQGEPWLVATDVCRVLGLTNVSNAVRPLRADEVTLHPIKGQRGLPMNVVSESGLYKLVLRSDKPEAKKFQDCVTRDVLPAIRKDGVYVNGAEKVATNKDVAAHFEKRHHVVMHA